MACNSECFSKRLQAEIPHLRRYARSVTKSQDSGEDLLQSALERALIKRSQFVEGTEFRRWLFTIVRNTHIDEVRKTARQGTAVPIEDWQPETFLSPSQEKHLELEDVAKSIEHLRPEDRQVLQMSVFAGLSHDEVAKEMGVAVGTVKSRLSRARQSLAA